LPPLVLAGLVIASIASPDRLSRLALLLDPNVIALVLVVEVALLAWRIGAVADAFRLGEGRLGGGASALTALGLLFVLVPSVYAAYLTEVAYTTATQVFSTVEAPGGWHPDRTPPPDPEFTYVEGTPEPTPQDLGRFTVLFIGADSGPHRSHLLTDTMIVASLDPISGAVSMVSMPRDTVDVPLSDGRLFRGKINSLVEYVDSHPKQFPGAPSGETVLADALGGLLGVPVDGWVEVNLPGFVGVVDSLGGINVTVHDGFCDPTYHDYGYPDGFSVTPGRYHFTGDQALAYARVRKALGESDFTRAARQQEVIVALRDRVVSGGFINDPAGFIASFGKLVTTNIDPSRIAPYIDPASHVTRDHIYRDVITYPLVKYLPGDPRGWVIAPRTDRIRALGAQAFPPAGTLPTGMDVIPPDDGTAHKGAPTGCAPAPKPTPKPTPTPEPTPSDAATPEPTIEPTAAPSAAAPASAPPTSAPSAASTPEPTSAPSP
jgi:LCP family protein required for cell wall assembly